MNSKKESFLLFDSDCGSCTRFASLVKRYCIGARIVLVPMTDTRSQSLVGGAIPKSMMFRSFHLVQIDDMGKKRISSAGDGLIRMIEHLPLGRHIAGFMSRARLSRNIVDWTYLQASRIRRGTCTSS